MGAVKPITNYLGTPGEPGAMSRSEAARKGSVLKSLSESEGWAVFLELIQTYQHHQQRVMMVKPASGDNVARERQIGEWRGMELAPSLVAGMIAVGATAAAEMEKGKAATAA